MSTCLVSLVLGLLIPAGASALTKRFLTEYLFEGVDCHEVCDVDGDGTDDLVLVHHGPGRAGDLVRILRSKGGALLEATRWESQDGRIEDVELFPSWGHAKRRTLAFACRGDYVEWIDCHSVTRLGEAVRLENVGLLELDGQDGWNGRAWIAGGIDLANNGTYMPVLAVSAESDWLPRGVLLFGGDVVFAQHATEGPIEHVYVCGFNSPESTAVVVCSGARGAGPGREQAFSASATVEVLNQRLRLLWSTEVAPVGEIWASAVFDFLGSASPEVLLGVALSGREGSPKWRIEARTLHEGRLLKYREMPGPISSLIGVDMDRNGAREIVGVWSGKHLILMDSTLSEIRSLDAPAPLEPLFDCDLDADGERELAAICGARELVLLDRELVEVAVWEAPENIETASVLNDGSRHAALLLSYGRKVEVLRLLPARPEYALSSGPGMRTLAASFAAGLLLATGGFLGLRRRRVLAERRRQRAAGAGEELLACLQAFGHSGLARSNLDRLAQYVETAARIEADRRSLFEQRLISIVQTYRDFTRGLLRRVIDLAAHRPELTQVRRRLRKAFETLDSLMGTEPGSRKGSLRVLERSAEVASAARDLVASVRDLRKQLLDSYEVDVAAVACRVGATWLVSRLDGKAVRMRFDFPERLYAQVETECLKTTLEVLLDNALEAVRGEERPEIGISGRREGQRVLLTVTDNGAGIPPEDWERVFERGFSSKGEGRGLGLFHVRQSLARFSAKVRVQSSAPGRGTVMAVEMLAASREDSQVQTGFLRVPTGVGGGGREPVRA